MLGIRLWIKVRKRDLADADWCDDFLGQVGQIERQLARRIYRLSIPAPRQPAPSRTHRMLGWLLAAYAVVRVARRAR